MRRILVVGLVVGLIAACSSNWAGPPSAQSTPANPTNFPPTPQSSPSIGQCPVFPLDNIWNTPIDNLPVHPRSSQYIASIGASESLHPDFGAGQWNGGAIGIPFVVVPANQPTVNVNFVDYPDESDPTTGAGQYPVPPNAPREHGSDHHVLVVREGECKLYELYNATKINDTTWNASNGAIFDLRSNALRPAGWTSADAAGLPILPGLVRYEEVQAGEIRHAIRFTIQRSQKAYVWPARHFASSITDLNVPPMGMRFRLKSSFDIAGFSSEVQVILRAMQRYGIIVADNGSDWYISGAPHPNWNDEDLGAAFDQIRGEHFEAVDSSSLQLNADSAAVVASAAPQPSKLAEFGGVDQGQQLRYAITVVGNGSSQMMNDQLPAGLTIVPASATINPSNLPAPTISNNSVQWSGTIPNSQSAVISFRATVSTNERRVIVNTAQINSRSVQASIIANGYRVWSPLVRKIK
ncbi:putative repeat protein (TIGR01451 family) [Herpetosiphon giganteus]|nr:DUF11 domain-containing protein [Herpetosiphon giganteus]MBM7844920.1 putative repeat protein (TIGR01451 family) [Herpetosiphon giganteus]